MLMSVLGLYVRYVFCARYRITLGYFEASPIDVTSDKAGSFHSGRPEPYT